MGPFVPPAGLGSVAPPSPAMGVTIGSSDQLVLDYIIGKTIIAGSQFADTLGRFFPIVINTGGLTINASVNQTTTLTFHNTASTSPDAIVYYNGAVVVFPNQAGTIGTTAFFLIADRNVSPYMGFLFYPGYTNGPRIYFADGTGSAIPVYAGGANYMYIIGGVAGTQPALTIGGSDTNISLVLTPKGTGTVYFNYAADALGGGAAPTLGTIGGTGPTTAGQNQWLRINVNGNLRWVPVWA